MGEWIGGAHAAAFREEVLQPGSLIAQHLDRQVLDRLFQAHQAGTTDGSYALWAAWALERWLQGHDALQTVSA